MYQDCDTVTLSTEYTTPNRSKHMLLKPAYVRSLELSGAVRLEYLSTTEMTADVLSSLCMVKYTISMWTTWWS